MNVSRPTPANRFRIDTAFAGGFLLSGVAFTVGALMAGGQ